MYTAACMLVPSSWSDLALFREPARGEICHNNATFARTNSGHQAFVAMGSYRNCQIVEPLTNSKIQCVATPFLVVRAGNS
jgi:hypothetical protein